MLKPIEILQEEDSMLNFISGGRSSVPAPIEGCLGMYTIPHFSFSSYVEGALGRRLTFDERYCSEGGIDSYGVCDSPLQWLASEQGHLAVASDKHYVAAFTRIAKSEQPEGGGWRWHKWGAYIGEHESLCEYLYDEPHIEEVWVFSVICVPAE